MWKPLLFVLVMMGVIMPRLSDGQEAKAVLDGVAKAMGTVKTLQYTRSGSIFAVGQSPSPGTPWPRFNAKSYTRSVNYDTLSMRDEIVRTQVDAPRGGGGQPVLGERRQNLAVSGTHAWSQTGETTSPQLAAGPDRLHPLWITPHGLIQAAMAHQATVRVQTEDDKKMATIAFIVPNQFKVRALVNDDNLVEKVESWGTNPVVGDMLTEITYTDYKDFDGVSFPTKITQKAGDSRAST